MSKNSKTFSQRAKELIKKYHRANYDETERKELESKLQELADEQEAYKAANNIDSEPFEPGSQHEYGGQGWDNYLAATSGGLGGGTSGTLNPGVGMSPYATSLGPTLIGSGVSMIGNLLGMTQNRSYKVPELVFTPREYKPSTIKLQRIKGDYSINPEDISFQKERDLAKQRGTTAKGRGKYAAKNIARTRGEYLANVLQNEAAINRAVSEQVGQSLQREGATNVAQRNRAREINAQTRHGIAAQNAAIANQEAQLQAQENARIQAMQQQAEAMQQQVAMSNFQAQQQAAGMNFANRQQNLQQLFTIPQQALSDITRIRQQDALINSLGQNYGWYMNPNQNWWQRNFAPQYQIQYRG